MERVGDIDPIGEVYLSFGGGELWQDRSTCFSLLEQPFQVLELIIY